MSSQVPKLPAKQYCIDAVREDGITYLKCLEAALEIPELIAQFDRLYGYNLSRRGPPINVMVDDATGYTDAGIIEFCNFVWNFVFLAMPIVDQSKSKSA